MPGGWQTKPTCDPLSLRNRNTREFAQLGDEPVLEFSGCLTVATADTISRCRNDLDWRSERERWVVPCRSVQLLAVILILVTTSLAQLRRYRRIATQTDR